MANDPAPGNERRLDPRKHADFDRLLVTYLDELNLSGFVDPEGILRDHPELGPAILEDLETYVELHCREEDSDTLGSLGDYTLRRKLGYGGMGVVYEAWENSMDRRVALKVLPTGAAADDKAFHRFMREARTAGKLSHPHVVPVFGVGIKEHTPYYAMEYVDGETLAQILKRVKVEGGETPFGDPRFDQAYYLNVARAFADVADGLQHAHSKGIIHRDVKPSNLILDRGKDAQGNSLRILDFGLARLEGQEPLTVSGDLVGTPLYMSPEQAQASRIQIDHRTDIYSLGATLYEVLTWRPPFEGKDHGDTLTQIIERDPRPPRQWDQRIPRDLETIVLKCLRKDPGDRFGTAEALEQDLRRFVRGDPVEARPQSHWQKVSHRLWRLRWRASLAGSLLLLLLVVGILARGMVQASREKAYKEYETLVEAAAWKLQRSALLTNEHTADIDLLDPKIASAFQYCFPEVFSRYGLKPPSDVIRSLERAIELVPTRPEAHYYLARAHLLLREKDEALEALHQATEADRRFIPALFLKTKLLAPGKGPPSVGATGPALRAFPPESWQGAWLRAHRALEHSDWQEAADAFATLYSRGDRSRRGRGGPYLGSQVESWFGKSKARLGAGDLDEAIHDLHVALHFWPEALQPLLLLAKAYYLAGDELRAESLFESFDRRVRREQPDSDGAILISALYLSLADHEKALRWTERIQNGLLRACATSEVLGFMGRSRDAEREALRAVGKDSGVPWSHTALGSALARQRRYREADRCFRRAIDLDESYVPAHVGLGHVLCARREWREGLNTLRKALKLDPRYAHAYDELGLALLRKDALHEAEAILIRALEEYPRYALFHAELGFVRMEMGLHEDALRAYEEALRLSPRSAVTHLYLGMAYARRKQVPEAIQALTTAVDIHPYITHSYRYLVSVLLEDAAADVPEELSRLVRTLQTQLTTLEPHPVRRKAIASLLLAALRLPTTSELDSAVELAWQEVDKPRVEARDLPDLLAAMATVADATGNRSEAVRLLEDAVAIPVENRDTPISWRIEEDLEDLRQALLPQLPSPASVDAAFASLGRKAIIPAGADWKYHPGTQEPSPPLAWARVDFDDRSWKEVALPLGLGLQPQATLLDDLQGRCSTLYVRRQFTVDDPGSMPRLVLRVCADDGLIVYFNGEETARFNVEESLSPLPHDATAEARLPDPPVAREIVLPRALLRQGENVVAIQVLNCSLTDWDLTVDATLSAHPETGVTPDPTIPREDQQPESVRGEDGRWALQQLAAGEPLRIDCGATEDQEADGMIWSRDRLFLGGARKVVDASLVPEGSERYFLLSRTEPVYRIPVPPGTYRVTLRFIESVYSREETLRRKIRVVVEGAEQKSLLRPEPGEVTRVSAEVTVDDGFLDIELGRESAAPAAIAAIEVEV